MSRQNDNSVFAEFFLKIDDCLLKIDEMITVMKKVREENSAGSNSFLPSAKGISDSGSKLKDRWYNKDVSDDYDDDLYNEPDDCYGADESDYFDDDLYEYATWGLTAPLLLNERMLDKACLYVSLYENYFIDCLKQHIASKNGVCEENSAGSNFLFPPSEKNKLLCICVRGIHHWEVIPDNWEVIPGYICGFYKDAKPFGYVDLCAAFGNLLDTPPTFGNPFETSEWFSFGRTPGWLVDIAGCFRNTIEDGGYGVIIRQGADGKAIIAASEVSKHPVSPLYVKLQGVKLGLELAIANGCSEVLVSTSSRYVASVVDGRVPVIYHDGPEEFPFVRLIMDEIRHLTYSFTYFSVVCLSRKENRAAEYLANLVKPMTAVPDDFPEALRWIVDEDANDSSRFMGFY